MALATIKSIQYNQTYLHNHIIFILFFSELNYCENNPGLCQNGAKCVSLTKEDGNFRCLCREGTYGRNCEFSEYTTTTTSKTTPVDNATTVTTTETSSITTKNPVETENETN